MPAAAPLPHLLWVVFVALVLPPAGASAQPRPDDGWRRSPALGASLLYRAPAACPDRASFERGVRARRGGRKGVARGRSFRIELTLEGGRAVGSIRVDEPGTPPARRRIEAANCAEAVDALALIAALALEQPAGPAPPPVAPRSSRRLRVRREVRPPGAEVVAETPAVQGEQSAIAPPAPVTPAARPQPARDTGAEPRSRPATGGQSQVSLSIAALALTGSAPAVQPALSLGADLRLRQGAPALKLALGARLSLAQHAQAAADQGAAEFRLAGGAFAACPGLRLAAARLWLWGCGVLEGAALLAEGASTQGARGARRLWLAAGPGVQLEWRASALLAVHAGLEGLLTLSRDRFLLADQVVHRVPALALRALAGLSLTLP